MLAKIKDRLSRIEGQVRGIRKMIDENRDCFEILKQVSAVNGALSSLQKMMLAQHIHGCLELALSSERDRTDLVDELVKHLSEVR